jgi:hypothetical protein
MKALLNLESVDGAVISGCNLINHDYSKNPYLPILRNAGSIAIALYTIWRLTR